MRVSEAPHQHADERNVICAPPEFTFSVIGTPGPQGSKSPKGRDGKGRAILVESSKLVKPWRESVKWEAFTKMREQSFEKICGPVYMEVTFTVSKPQCDQKKKRRTYPDRKPDLSKLVRSTEDALSEAGVWEDDARVIRTISSKVYPNEGRDSLPVPGAVIRIRSAVEEM